MAGWRGLLEWLGILWPSTPSRACLTLADSVVTTVTLADSARTVVTPADAAVTTITLADAKC